MEVEVEDEGKVCVSDNSDVSTLLEKLDYHLDSVIVLSDDEPVPLDHPLKEDMKLKIVSVVSGG
ncbi:MAG: MoaD/ThiS family protein [Candidatus Thermoplasmatota archaeon]|nr:MoaD/ThiS family protein [Candidatus Thermoplasmatota archaeon]